ncbi:type II toxin-antitoxin system death-on-curing family toxin [Vibrio lentus]
MKFFYFDTAHAIGVHDWVLETTGGSEGVVNIGLLESPLEHIQNDDYYPTLEEKLTHLVYSINKNHAFQDGNKRTSIALGGYLLKLNGYDFLVTTFTIEMENVAIWVADNVISKELLSKIIYSIVNDDEYPEEVKLEIATATMNAQQ